MLKARILTASILIPLVLLLIFKSSTLVFFAVTMVLILAAAWEWTLFLGVSRLSHCIFYLVFILTTLILCLFIPINYILDAAVIFWILAAIVIVAYPRGRTIWGNSIVIRSLMGAMVLIPCIFSINLIHASPQGPFILLFLFMLIWSADIAAYFTGKKCGRYKLLPQVSPGKTWEGVGGGIIVTMLIALGVLWGFNLPKTEWPWAIALSFFTVVFSIIGDLFESVLKRNVGIKDSGQWLPGHGGLLDRIDSLTAAAPIFTLGALWMGKVLH